MSLSATVDSSEPAADSNEPAAHGFFFTLWKSRCHPTGSWKLIAKTWLKRIYHAPSLHAYASRRRRLIASGHEIAPLTALPQTFGGGPGILRIGPETAIVGRVTIALHADVSIGSRVVINDGAKLLTGSHNTADPEWKAFAKPIIIKDYAWIAENSIILPGVTIGRGAVVGAGSVVQTDIPDYSIAFGNPARVYPVRRPAALDYNPIRQVAPFEAWLGSEQKYPGELGKSEINGENRASSWAASPRAVPSMPLPAAEVQEA